MFIRIVGKPFHLFIIYVLSIQVQHYFAANKMKRQRIIQEFNCQLWTWFTGCTLYKNLRNLISHNYFTLCIEIIHWFSTKEFLKITNHEKLFNRKKLQLEIFHTMFIFLI